MSSALKHILRPLLCKLGKHRTLYEAIEYEKGNARPEQDQCIYCNKKFVWVYLGREDKMFSKCEVLDE